MSQQEEGEPSDRKKYEFQKVIEDLREYEGSGTSSSPSTSRRTSRSATWSPT